MTKMRMYIRTSCKGTDQGQIATQAGGFNRVLPYWEANLDEKATAQAGGKKRFKVCPRSLCYRNPGFIDKYVTGMGVKESDCNETHPEEVE
jgi:hypothetical protein